MPLRERYRIRNVLNVGGVRHQLDDDHLLEALYLVGDLPDLGQ